MTDLVARAGAALAHPSLLTLALVLAVGVLSSVGPCAAPRVFALAGLLAGAQRPGATTAAFVGGLILTYVTLGTAASALAAVRAWTSFLEIGLALGLAASGLLALRTHVHHERVAVPRTLGGVAFAGAAFGFNVSPCCTPLIASIGAYAAVAGRPDLAVVYLATFGLGHAAPLLVLGALGGRVRRVLARAALSHGAATVSAGVLFLLAGYYALLVV